jgi:TolB-like protein
LPLETSGDDPADELVALGLTEELLTELGSLDSRHLALLSLSASQPLADNPQPVQELQRLLEADWVLSGSIRRSQSQTVLQLRLEGTADRRLLWTERFVETDGAMASAQRDLGIRAVRSLAEALEIPYQADARPAENPEARQAYLQGTYLLIKGGPDDALRSVPFFQRAVEIDPTNARAHAGLAEALLVSGGLPDDPAGDPQLQARNAALLALELNPSLAGPHLALAWLAAAEDWDLEEARRHVDRALELDPNFSEALHVKACFDLLAGDIEAGLQRAERAAALHPAAPSAQADLAWNYFYARRFEQALVAARTTLELESRNIAGFRVQMHSLLQLGRAQEALAHGKLLMQRRGADEEILGRMEELPPEEALEIFWQWWWQGNLRLQQQGYITREGLVEAALQLGRREEALTLLETSAEAREPYVLFLPVDARFDPLRAEARFEALLERIVRGG